LSAFEKAHLTPSWVEWDRQALDSPPYAKQHGSPTILVDGNDVVGSKNDNNHADCCRLYIHEQGFKGIPQLSQVVKALTTSTVACTPRQFHWRRFLAVCPSLVALLPVLHCPACWPAYAGILSALGLGFLLQSTYLAPITSVFLILVLFTLGYKARARHGYVPLTVGLIAVAVILTGKFLLSSEAFVYGGLMLLFVTSIWNACPRKEVCCENN
ncbi:MAG: MerC domain-containing protein, partial [Candidatus Melainabacteria bacterium]|nr:MerC domain-containing protein [Candidatus Melainabacteria bacterium]